MTKAQCHGARAQANELDNVALDLLESAAAEASGMRFRGAEGTEEHLAREVFRIWIIAQSYLWPPKGSTARERLEQLLPKRS